MISFDLIICELLNALSAVEMPRDLHCINSRLTLTLTLIAAVCVCVFVCDCSAWLMDSVDPLIARVSRRAAGLSNLTLESAEDLQVHSFS